MRFIALLLRSWNNASPFQCTTTPLFNDENWNSMQFRSPSYFHRQWKRFRSKKNTASRIMRYAAQLLLNADELIIFGKAIRHARSEEHTSELQSLMRISYAVLCLNNKKQKST